MILSATGAAYGTAKAGITIAGVGTFAPQPIMKSLIAVIMSGIIAVYGLVIAVLITEGLSPTKSYSLFSGVVHLGAGLSVGFAGLAAGVRDQDRGECRGQEGREDAEGGDVIS